MSLDAILISEYREAHSFAVKILAVGINADGGLHQVQCGLRVGFGVSKLSVGIEDIPPGRLPNRCEPEPALPCRDVVCVQRRLHRLRTSYGRPGSWSPVAFPQRWN
jgi:hypothetical protein